MFREGSGKVPKGKSSKVAGVPGRRERRVMTDWYFAGMFDETFWAVLGSQKLRSRTAAEVLRPLVAEAREPDLSCISKVRLLDALCRLELTFAI